MTLLKVCGITRVEDAAAARRLGYDAIGMLFAESPRQVSPDQARLISRSLPTTMLRVGVFVNPEEGELKKLIEYCGLDLIQLHGEESPQEVARLGARAIKALRLREPEELTMLEDYPGVFAILLDTWDSALRGGTGHTGNWDLAARAAKKARVILAGGLDPRNVGRAIAHVRPFGVDVCSGVEHHKRIKDHGLMRDFISEARAVGSSSDKEDP